MQQLAIEQRRPLGPRAPWHIGDVDYCMTEPACALYRSLGLRVHVTLVAYSR